MDDFEDFLWRLSRQLMNMVDRGQATPQQPYFELTNTKEGIKLTAELPGAAPEDVRVSLSKDMVRVTVMGDCGPAYSSVFDRVRIDPKDARISYKNGVLEVFAPKRKAVF